MKNVIRFAFIFVAIMLLSLEVFPQYVIVLKNKYRTKNIKLYVNNRIKIETKDVALYGRITYITDNSIVLENQVEFKVREIQKISVLRSLYFQASKMLPIAGLAYVGIDAGNRAMNNQKPVFDKSTIMIGSGLVLSHFVFKPLSFKKIKLGDKWKMEILNLGN